MHLEYYWRTDFILEFDRVLLYCKEQKKIARKIIPYPKSPNKIEIGLKYLKFMKTFKI